ncbi:MAG: helix-turn-helix domain-containing protein [Pirellulaceae bacterium]|nr:helix-turn-helix domain-containing protein [Pirellulaceae bacterium]
MSNFVSLEDAAKRLGLSADQLIEMRSRGDIFGYRDGASWKFRPEEIERVASELLGDVLDEDPAGSSILSLDPDASSASSGLSSSSSGSLARGSGSDVSLQVDPASSDLKLVANSDLGLTDPDAGSGISHVDLDGLQLADSDDDEDEISLGADDDDEIEGEVVPPPSGKKFSTPAYSPDKPVSPASGSSSGSELNLLDETQLATTSVPKATPPASQDKSAASDLKLADDGLIQGDSDPAILSGSGSSGHGSDLVLDDELSLEDELVLGSSSDVALGANSGIDLKSPADSGISLEGEPLDLAASGISGLDLSDEASSSGSGPGGSGGSLGGSGVDFQQDEEFQLSPSGGLEVDDDSGSQVIELEDSGELADLGNAPADAFDAFSEVGEGGDVFGGAAPAMGTAAVGTPEVPYSTLQVILLLGILLIMSFSGILLTDVVRNLWAWSGNENALTSGFTDMLVGIFK